MLAGYGRDDGNDCIMLGMLDCCLSGGGVSGAEHLEIFFSSSARL